MPQIINTNIASLTAQRNLNSSQSANRTSLERLSSGLRINSAKDDAAGLAISTRFSSQIRGLSVAIRNAGDGISLAQTAEGALNSITSSLQRLRELALQSSNATNSDVDREALNAEAQQLISEITRTGEQTDFNGTNLLDGNFAASFQVGANAGETVSFGIAELTASNLGGGRTAGVSAIGSNNGLANGDLVINGAVIGPSVASDDTSSFANAPASAISKVAAINRASEQSGVKAEVLTNIAAGSVQNEATGGSGATTGSITLNGVEIALATGDVDEAADRTGIVAAINARSGETGVVAVDTGTRFGGVNLEASDGRNITLEFSSGNLSAASTGLTSQETTSGGYTLSATTSGTAIVISESTGDISNSGLVAGTYTANTAAVSTAVRTSEDGAPTSAFDTAAVAASVSSSNDATAQAAQAAALIDFGSGNTLEFDLRISDATTTSENQTFTVQVTDDLSGGTIQDLADSINSSIASSSTPIAVTASVGEDGNLTFTRDTAEAGSLEVRNFQSNGVVDTATVATVLGVSENSIGSGADTISADTVIAATNATVTGGSAVDTSALSTTLSTTNSISFDVSISGSSQQAAQTVTVTLDDNSLVNGTTSAADLATVINAEIALQSTTLGVTASADDSGNLVFTTDLAGAATLEVSNVQGNGSIGNAEAATVLGFSNNDADGNGTIGTGANATTVGAVNAAANYFLSGNSFTAGAASSTDFTFETGSAESAVLNFGATATTTTSTGIDLQTAGAIEFSLSLDNGEAVSISTAASTGVSDASQAQVVNAINTALDGAFGVGAVIATFSDNQLEFRTGVGGSQRSLEVTSVTGSPAADTLNLSSQVGVQAVGIGGNETAQFTIAAGNPVDFDFNFNGVAAGSLGGSDVNNITADNISFDVTYDNGTAPVTDTITISTDSSAIGATASYGISVNGAALNVADGGPSALTGVALDDASGYQFDISYQGRAAETITASGDGSANATVAELVADIQNELDAALAAANTNYTAGDIQVSIAGNGAGSNDEIVFTAINPDQANSILVTAGSGNGVAAGDLNIVNGTNNVSTARSETVFGSSRNTSSAVITTGGAAGFSATEDFEAASVSFDINYTDANGNLTSGNVLIDIDNSAGSLAALLADIQSGVDAALGSNVVQVFSAQDTNDGFGFQTVAGGEGVSLSITNINGAAASVTDLGFASTADIVSGTAADSLSGADDDANGRFIDTVNAAINASSFSTTTDFAASVDKDDNLVFETVTSGVNIELTAANFVGSQEALDAFGVSGTAREQGVSIAQDVGLSGTAATGGATGVDISRATGATAVGDVFDFSLSFNGGPEITVQSAQASTALDQTNATAAQLVTELQRSIDDAFATAIAANTYGDPNAGSGPAYDAGDIQVSINTSGEIVFSTRDTSGETSLEITNGNNDGLAALSFAATGEVTNTTTSGDSAAKLTLSEPAGTVDVGSNPAGGNFTGVDYSANNVTFQVTYDDGSGGPAVTGTATIDADLQNVDSDTFVAELQQAIDNVAGITAGDIVASIDSDGFISFTTDAARGSGVSLTIDTFTDADGTGAGLTALGLGNGITTPFADLSFSDTGADSAITTNADGSRFNDEGANQAAQNNTLTVSGLQDGDETITLSGSFTSLDDVLAEVNSQLSNATASADADGVITITDNNVTQDAEGNTVGISGNAAVTLGFDGSGAAASGIINEGAGGAGNETLAIRSLLDGDIRINGVSIAASRSSDDTASNELANSSSKAASGIAIAAAINRSTETTGVIAEVNATVVSGGTSNTDRVADGDQGEVYVNGISTGVIALGTDKETNRANAISAINQISGQTGVTATDNGGGITLTAADGRNLSVAIDTLGTNFTGENIGLNAASKGIAEADFAAQGLSYADVAATTSSTIRLSSSSEFTVAAGTNGAVGDDGFGGLEGLGIKAGTYGGAESGQFLNEIDISTVDGALSALDALDNALSSVSSERANLGAIQNRLQSTIDNLSISVENLQAANSRILDADFAAETAELSRTQVLQQAGISILAQANAAPQQVLSLLQ